MTFKPVIFKPNGSFRSLKESGKLSCEQHEKAIYQGRTQNHLAKTKHYIPGYTGFVRGKQHIAGRTYGNSTRRALSKDYKTIVTASPIPPPPQQKRDIELKCRDDSFLNTVAPQSDSRIPGYTGYVPNVKSTVGKSYGAATSEGIAKSKTLKGISNSTSNGNMGGTRCARPAFSKHVNTLDSSPLPGGANTNQQPHMYVPSHVKYLRYMS